MPTREVILETGAGRFHRAAVRALDGVETRLTAEGCNLDDATEVREVDALPPDVDAARLCERCFRPPEIVEA